MGKNPQAAASLHDSFSHLLCVIMSTPLFRFILFEHYSKTGQDISIEFQSNVNQISIITRSGVPECGIHFPPAND